MINYNKLVTLYVCLLFNDSLNIEFFIQVKQFYYMLFVRNTKPQNRNKFILLVLDFDLCIELKLYI